MPRKRLTKEGIAKLKPPPKGQIDYHDAWCPGLILRVNYGGRKTWLARHFVKRPGKPSMPTTHKLGGYPAFSLDDAREKARAFLVDPAKAQAATGSFKEVAENFLVRHVKANKLRTGRDYERILNKLVVPHWQDRPFRDIRRSDVTALLDRIEDENGSRQAGVVLAIVSKLFNWYAARSDDYSSPVVRGMRSHGPHKRDRWLDDDEIRAGWAACGDLGTFGAFVRVLLVTAQRRGKVAAMRWQDIMDGVWHIRREVREKGAPERLLLPQLVRDVIEAQPRLAGTAYVFAGMTGGLFTSVHLRKRELDTKMPEGTAPWVLHDLRRTARKLMTRAGVRVDVAEMALGHAFGGVRAHYDDPREYQQQIDAAVQAVADQIERIIGGNVVSLRTRDRTAGGRDPPAGIGAVASRACPRRGA
jgi:integrase